MCVHVMHVRRAEFFPSPLVSKDDIQISRLMQQVSLPITISLV